MFLSLGFSQRQGSGQPNVGKQTGDGWVVASESAVSQLELISKNY